MPNLRANIANHWKRLQKSNGIGADLSGKRNGQAINGSACVVLARTDSQALTTREVTADADAQDVLVEVCEWMKWFNSPPQSGDKIAYRMSNAPWGREITAEVRPMNDSVPSFSWWYGGEVFRVHCKIVERND